MQLSRKTIRLLGAMYQGAFSSYEEWGFQFLEGTLYDFVFEAGIDHTLCIEMRNQRFDRNLQDWIMRRCVEPGSTQLAVMLAQAALDESNDFFQSKLRLHLRGLIELDGYVMRDGRLVALDGLDVVPVEQTQDAITVLFRDLALPNDVVLHHLTLSENHFLAERWDDSIGNSRKVLEESLKEIAHALSTKLGAPLGKADLEKPAKVRDYLESQGILEAEEKRAYAGAYSLLSHAGGHPYIARKDQARLLRNVALTYTQFALLQWEGKAAAK